MSSNQPGRDENMAENLNATAADEQLNQDTNLEDTQERSDALAAVPENPSDEPLDSPVENINIDPDLTPEDAGEIPGGPDDDANDMVDSADTADAVDAVDAAASMESTGAEPATADESSETAPAAERAPAASTRPPSRFSRGQLIEGTVSSTSPTSITVDLGDGETGIVPGRELERMSRRMIEDLAEGQPINVYVVNPRDHQGNVVLSINRAIEEMDWKEAEAYRADQRAYEANIAGYNKGGLIVRFGRLRGFVPQSQMSDERRRAMEGETPEERYGTMVNDSIIVKVMEVDRARNRLILSERAATREVRERRKEDLIEKLAVGQVLEGRVVSLEDFGAFVDVGGAEGLVHLTELSWKHVNHPRDLLRVGQRVKVEVISVDADRKRIGLSMKRQEADPWDEVATTYQQGQLVQATVTKMTKFGAFARLVDAPDIEGLIHISELSDQRVNHPREVVKEGEKLTLRVVKVDVKNRRLGLSLKRVNSAEYLDVDMNFFANEDASSSVTSTPPSADDDTTIALADAEEVTGVSDDEVAVIDDIVADTEDVADAAEADAVETDVVEADNEEDIPSATDPDEEDETA
jgi:small subunit ribosomal protein S1